MFVKCSECNGKGSYIPQGLCIEVECCMCRGKGGFEVPKGQKLCPKCKGSGYALVNSWLGIPVEVTCDKCKGKGRVPNNKKRGSKAKEP